MPTRNSRKVYLPDSFYHIYSRGHNKSEIFHTAEDYKFFLSLLKRYLSPEQQKNKNGRLYPNHSKEVELAAFCIMPNHIHLLVHQHTERGIQKLMHSVMTSYSMYYNQTHGTLGSVFQGRYLASLVDKDSYLHHISRYIHLNPKDYREYEYSSLQYYLGSKKAEWLNTSLVMSLFRGPSDYLDFLADYDEHQQMLQEMNYEIAD